MNTTEDFSFYFMDLFISCVSSTTGTYIYSAWFVLYVLFSPLFLLVLYVGLTKWRKQRNSAEVSVNHCVVFTVHMMALELLRICASGLFLYKVYSRAVDAVVAGALFSLTLSGQVFFHSLTCGERYLAVVHPITYLRLKRGGGVTVRNCSIAGAWLLSAGYMLITTIVPHYWAQVITHVLVIVLILATVTFCSVSILRALIRPGPGEVGGKRKGMDQSKRSALTTIAATSGVLLARLVQLIVVDMVYIWGNADQCVMAASALWVSLPSSLVVPLLFLYRAGTLPAC